MFFFFQPKSVEFFLFLHKNICCGTHRGTCVCVCVCVWGGGGGGEGVGGLTFWTFVISGAIILSY